MFAWYRRSITLNKSPVNTSSLDSPTHLYATAVPSTYSKLNMPLPGRYINTLTFQDTTKGHESAQPISMKEKCVILWLETDVFNLYCRSNHSA